MTEKIIKRVKDLLMSDTHLGERDYIKIVDALEKQVPQKPILDECIYRCPICESQVRGFIGMQGFCSGCGQSIDWSEVG